MRHSVAAALHIYLKGLIGQLGIPRDERSWPKAWKSVSYKRYTRLPQIPLPESPAELHRMAEILLKRRSHRSFETSRQLSLDHLAALLRYGAGIRSSEDVPLETARRTYPSGGALYPLELYIATAGTGDLQCGAYHYNVAAETLEKIGDERAFEAIRRAATYPFAHDAPTLVVLTCVWNRSLSKYKDWGYPVVHLEAGHLAQNLLLIATALGLQSCALAGYHLDALSEALDLDPYEEAPVHMLLFGTPPGC